MLRNTRAFSLLELLLALGTMAATLLLVIALGISVAGRNQQVTEAPVGMVTAESVLNQFIYNVQYNAVNEAAFFSKPTTANYVTDTLVVDRVTFTYAVDLDPVINASTSAPMGAGSLSNTNRMMKITVRVTWQMGNGANQGKHQAEMTRLMHEDS